MYVFSLKIQTTKIIGRKQHMRQYQNPTVKRKRYIDNRKREYGRICWNSVTNQCSSKKHEEEKKMNQFS